MLKTSSAGTGFMHEAFKKDDPTKYSRRWFAWVNNLYGEMIIKVLREHPEILAKPIPPGF
jgi:meiotically up-regulated gene 157 (Mug157) protein